MTWRTIEHEPIDLPGPIALLGPAHFAPFLTEAPPVTPTELIAAALLACGLLSLLYGRDAVLRRGP